MSSTNRGAIRRTDDQYQTPRWCARRLAEVMPLPEGSFAVEPCVGAGNIVAEFTDLRWSTNDINQEGGIDFLESAAGSHHVAYVITNPPYSLAEEFIRHARALYPRATLVFLLRMAFLSSEGRIALWKIVGIPDLYVLPNRPSFTGKGTDSADYAWFVFPPSARTAGEIKVLASTTLEERRRG